MRSEFLKIAGVKSEAEFYKKFPSEEAFMKKHGKAIKKLKAKKAKIGTMVPNISTSQSNLTPIRIDQEYMDDSAAKLMGGKSTKELKDDAMYNAKLAADQQTANPQGGGGLGGMLGQLGGMLSGSGSGGGGDTSQFSQFASSDMSGTGFDIGSSLGGGGNFKNGGTTKKFKAHKMYGPKGEVKIAKTLKEHLALKKKGWGHNPPKAQGGDTMSQFGDVMNSDAVQNWGVPIVSDALEIADQIEAQKEALGSAKQERQISDIALQASKTTPEKVDRSYVRPEDFSNTGEEFFPVYGVGTNALAKTGGVYKAQRGKSTSKPHPNPIFKKHNDSLTNQYRKYTNDSTKIREGQLLHEAIPKGEMNDEYRKAFAELLYKYGYKAQTGGTFKGEYMPLVNPNQQKSFGQGGYLKQAAQGFTSFDAGNASYGGGMGGAAGTQFAGMLGVNDDAGSKIGGKIGGTIGSAFGPLGSFAGAAIGSAAGDLLDRNDRRQRLENEVTAKNTKEMAYGAAAPAIQAGYASYVKNGGKVPAYRSGGNMRGDYVSPNPSALDTMKMGGNLKTLWGGKAETVSYNPYAGGESIQFKGNSHDYRDPSTGQTGIGVAYGDDAKKMSMGGDITSNASVEVENEPAQEIDDSLVVYGDMKIPEEYISEIGDERAKGKKYKNYVANVLNKDEASINRTQAKVADLGLESDDTVFGQLERRTADVVLKGADMKLKNIAEKKSILADLQEAMNETFDDYGIKANEFINKRKLVEDPMRIENAKYGARLKMGEDGVETTGNETTNPPSLNDFDKKQIPLTDMTVEELKAAGYKVDSNNPNVYIRRNPETNTTEAVEMSGSSLGYTPEGQAIDPKTSFAGGVTQEDYDTLKENNPWFDWAKTDPNKMVTYKGKKVSSAILKFQKEFNKRAKEAGIDPVKVDGIFGQETRDAVFTPAKEAEEVTNYTEEKVMLGDTDTTTETTTVAPKGNIGPGANFNNSPEDQSLDKNQLLGEYYAMATNQVQPVQAQGFQPQLRVPYDISLQDMRNDVTSQSRAMQRNATLQNNPAALALAQAPTYDALNKINAEEFRQNQAMKDNVYSGNQATLNDAMLKNLGIYDQQADRQAQAAANTRTQNIDILNSISDKYSKNKLENVMNKVYANMYPTFKYDEDQRLNVVNPTQFNTGQGMTGISPLSMAQGITGGNQGVNNAASLLSWFSQNNPFKKEIKEEEGKTKKVEELEEIPESGKYGKKVTKNNKNSNILRAIRNL